MGSFTAGLLTGCLLGVSGTFVFLLVGVTFYRERSTVWNRHSFWGLAYAAATLVTLASASQLLKLDKVSSILLLLLGVLAISKQGGLLIGLVASAVAAVVLGIWLPPAGSLLVKSPDDRLALALFLLVATLGSRLIGGRRESSA